MKSEQLVEVACAPECGFRLQTHDKLELFNLVKTHAKGAHDMKMSDRDVEGRMRIISG
jgi:predicted small metal-binding protein